MALRADASRLLQAVHGVEAAMAAATDDVKEALARGLAELGSTFDEFRWMLAGLQETLARVQARQTLQLALQRQQLDLQRQQLVKTNLLLQRQQGIALVPVPALLADEVEAVLPPADLPSPYKGMVAYEPEDAELFFGREALVAELTARMAGTRFLAVAGPSGSGKSSLVRAGLLPAIWQDALPGTDAAYSSDGARLATAAVDGAVTIWDAVAGQELLTSTGHTLELNEIVFSPNDEHLATASKDDTVRVWDATTGQELLSLTAPSGGWSVGNDVVFDPRGDRLITADWDAVVTVWDLATGKALLTLSGMPPIAISPDGKLLATTTSEDELVLWDLEASLAAGSGQTLSDRGHGSAIYGITFSPDGTRLATGGSDPTARLWTLGPEGVQESLILAGHTAFAGELAFSPDGRSLATGSSDGTVKVWDLTPSGNQELLTRGGHSDRLRWIYYSPDGARLATTKGDGHAVILDAETGETLLTFAHPTGAVWEAVFSPDGARLATAGEDNTARLWDATSGQELLTLAGHAEAPPVGGLVEGIVAVAFSPDGKLLASTGADGQAILWDAETGERVTALQVHPDGIGATRLAFSPDGSRLATASDAAFAPSNPEGGNPLVSVWDLASGERLYTVTGLPNRAWALAFSPDGTKLVVPVDANFFKVYDAATGEESLSIAGLSGRVISVAFSPDGALLATGDRETLRLWDPATGQELKTLPGHTGMINGLSFSPDGTRLVSSSLDGTTRVYTLDVDELVALAQSRLTRWFTPAECQQYLHVEECPPEP